MHTKGRAENEGWEKRETKVKVGKRGFPCEKRAAGKLEWKSRDGQKSL